MRIDFAAVGVIAGLLTVAGGRAAEPGQQRPAQPVRPATMNQDANVFTMEIINGPVRTQHYFPGKGMAAGDRAKLRDLERAQNEMATLQLSSSAVPSLGGEQGSDRDLRQAVVRLYNAVPSFTPGIYPDLVPLSDALTARAFYRGYGYDYGVYYPGYVGGLYPYGLPAIGYPSAVASTSAVLPVSSGPDERQRRAQAERARRDYEAARAEVAKSENLRKAVGLDATGGGTAVAGFETRARPSSPRVVITLTDKTKVEGTLVREEPDKLVVNTDAGEVEVSRSQIATILRPSARMKPADRREE